MIRRKQISPVEVARTLLARIERLQPQVNAYAHLDPALTLAAAEAAETAVMRGDRLGSLHGLPVGIKDLMTTADMPTEHGSATMRGNRPTRDAPSVARARAAGAVFLGKTTTSEFGWTGVSRSPLTGITHNPWRHGFNAGASSAGAGAAAAAGLGPLQFGTDGAGSIRMPAHFCGVFGLKPTYGRVPQHPVSLGDYTSHVGPLTRTVADAALMLRAIAGPDPLDHTSLDAAVVDYPAYLRAGIRGARIAYSPDLGHARVDPEVAACVATAVARFEELGAHVEQVPTPWAAEGPALIRAMWPAHLTSHLEKLDAHGGEMDPGLVACVRAGAATTMAEYQQLRARKYAYVAALQAWLADWDFLLTPAVSVAAFPAERLMPADWPAHDWDWVGWAEFSYPFNFSGNPAASVPCGFTADGLPIGLQIVGRRFDDLGVLQAAAAFEAIAPWADRRPAL
jgi:aspartyl-tRNA(Asn)/glutamyl-tRNA(Gln) amidotransferase subunit A